ncbi:hypothetical protein ACFSTC_19135 [Nonomuraea ferruginea]
MVAAVQAEVLPYDKNLLRHADRLTPALAALHDLWRGVRAGLHGTGGPRPYAPARRRR